MNNTRELFSALIMDINSCRDHRQRLFKICKYLYVNRIPIVRSNVLGLLKYLNQYMSESHLIEVIHNLDSVDIYSEFFRCIKHTTEPTLEDWISNQCLIP